MPAVTSVRKRNLPTTTIYNWANGIPARRNEPMLASAARAVVGVPCWENEFNSAYSDNSADVKNSVPENSRTITRLFFTAHHAHKCLTSRIAASRAVLMGNNSLDVRSW